MANTSAMVSREKLLADLNVIETIRVADGVMPHQPSLLLIAFSEMMRTSRKAESKISGSFGSRFLSGLFAGAVLSDKLLAWMIRTVRLPDQKQKATDIFMHHRPTSAAPF